MTCIKNSKKYSKTKLEQRIKVLKEQLIQNIMKQQKAEKEIESKIRKDKTKEDKIE